MPITSLNHYLIVSKDLERSRKFYEQVFGCVPVPPSLSMYLMK